MTRLLIEPATDTRSDQVDAPAEDARPSRPARIGPLSAAVKGWFRRAAQEKWTQWTLACEEAEKLVPSRRAKSKRQRPAKNAKRQTPVTPELDWNLLDSHQPLDWLALAYHVAIAAAEGHSIPTHGAERLTELAAKSAHLSLAADPLRHQIAAGEIPLLLAALAGDSPEANAWGDQARRTLSRGVVDLCDGDGLVEAKHLPIFWQLLACWTRCRSLSRAVGGSCFDETAEPLLAGALAHALKLLRSDGSAVFSSLEPAALQPLLLAAIGEFADVDERLLAAKLLPVAWTRGLNLQPAAKGKAKGKSTAKKSKSKKDAKPTHPPAGTFSDWGHFAQLRSSATRLATRLTVAYDRDRVSTELESAGQLVWSGNTVTHLTLDGELVAPAGDWEETCWLEEDEADYLELSIDYERGIELQRQILLVREAGVVFLADVVLSPMPGKIEHQLSLPLRKGLSLHRTEETREAFLREGMATRATIVPPAFPEWAATPANGSLTDAPGWLHFHTRHAGANLYAPLVLDLDPRRAKKEITWRQLTVAENHEPVGPDLAAGYRVRIGNRHWLFYRALDRKGNRTVFGVNLITEFLASRIDANGIATTLIEVE